MRKNNDTLLPWYFDKLSNHTTVLQPNGGVVGLLHRGSRRINVKFVGDLWQFVFAKQIRLQVSGFFA